MTDFVTHPPLTEYVAPAPPVVFDTPSQMLPLGHILAAVTTGVSLDTGSVVRTTLQEAARCRWTLSSMMSLWPSVTWSKTRRLASLANVRLFALDIPCTTGQCMETSRPARQVDKQAKTNVGVIWTAMPSAGNFDCGRCTSWLPLTGTQTSTGHRFKSFGLDEISSIAFV